MKVMTILGTRPEIIRLSRVIPALDAAVNHVLVHTGQNHDHALSGVFFDDLSLRAPDRILDVAGGCLGETLGNILAASEKVLREEEPDAVLILGDTNSALSAIMARRLHIPIFHMEAGNRCFDWAVPEEANRRMVDHIADFNLVYTEHARRNLIVEGLPEKLISKTGSPMREVLERCRERIEQSAVLPSLGLEPGGYIVASLHREETVDHRANLERVIATLGELARRFDRLILFSTHPRTRKRLDEQGIDLPASIRLHEPFGFYDYCHLQTKAFCAVSDSGTISEEAAILGFPAVTMRNASERPEALETGTIILSGLDAEPVCSAVETQVNRFAAGDLPPCPTDYEIPDTSARVLALITGQAGLAQRSTGVGIP